MVRLVQKDGKYAVYRDEQLMGFVELYDNPGHGKNRYVRLELELLDTEISGELFSGLRALAGRPLQAMVSSEDMELIAFLTAGGFRCRRKCYEVQAGAADYIGGKGNMELTRCAAGEPDYDAACGMLFQYYLATHEAVNPWTAGYTAFSAELPADVICGKADGRMVSLAFVEGNEIAYVCGADRQHFADFARSLASVMLEKYETVFFESDDCDWAAMTLKALFTNQDESSLDTYVYD